MSQGFTSALPLPLPVASGGTGVSNSNWSATSLTLTSPLGISSGGTGTSVAPSTFYVNTANTSVGSSLTTVKYSNVVNDSANAYSTTTGVYTVPTTGWYIVNAGIKFSNYNYGSSAIIDMAILNNGSGICENLYTPAPYNATSPTANLCITYKFTAGNSISVVAFSNIGGGGGTTLDNSVINFLSINFLHS